MQGEIGSCRLVLLPPLHPTPPTAKWTRFLLWTKRTVIVPSHHVSVPQLSLFFSSFGAAFIGLIVASVSVELYPLDLALL